MDQEFKKEIILNHYQNPINKGLIDSSNYIKISTNSDSCIDEIDLMIKIEDGIIKDVRFDGEACCICTSSTSIMIETLIDKNIDEAVNIINNFGYMIDEKEYNSEILGSANVYDDIYKQPNRKKCALLPWIGMNKGINEYKNK